MFRPLLPVLLMLAPLLASCGDNAPSEIAVSEVWARASVTKTGAAYATIENRGGADDTLVEVLSPVAERVEIHYMTMDGMVMKMRKLDALPVKAGESVALAPGGKHIMLIGLHGPLDEEAPVPLTLVFEKAGKIELTAPVRPAGGTGH
ncbi:MAG: copper chaperone PCu(A)C [Parvibaculum sp.]|nr:copper chaperone PCu(A)C [Parvibaculum sp.]